MKIDILTLFPDMYKGFLTESIIKRAIDKNLVEVNIINFRDYSPLNNKQVDDTIYGGGSGMLLRIEPIYYALEALRKNDTHVILLSPEGKIYNQEKAYKLSNKEHIILICGHYEGFDERIKELVDEVISVGKFVLTGGEIPSMLIADSIIRLLPGVINKESLKEESFNDDYYDYPKYTKPSEFKGMSVPEVLQSGNHELINKWRKDNKKRVE